MPHERCNGRCDAFRLALNAGDYILSPYGDKYRIYNEKMQTLPPHNINWKEWNVNMRPPNFHDLADLLCYQYYLPNHFCVIVEGYSPRYPAKAIRLTLTFKEV